MTVVPLGSWLVLPLESSQQGLSLSSARSLCFQQGNDIWLTADGSCCTFQSLSGCPVSIACQACKPVSSLINIFNKYYGVSLSLHVPAHTYSCMHTHIIHTYTHPQREGWEGGSKKKKKGKRKTQLGRWARWKTQKEVFDFIFPFTEKEKETQERKKRPTEQLPLDFTRLPQAHHLRADLEFHLHKGSCFGWVELEN